MQRRFAERRVNANVEWCVVIGQCHGKCARRHQSVCSFQRWCWRDVYLRVLRDLPNKRLGVMEYTTAGLVVPDPFFDES